MKNKYFILIFLVTALFAVTGCGDDNKTPPPPVDEIEVREGMNLVGKIRDGETPIPNVVVSDGYTTCVTDSEGIYQMKASRHADFVFISIPEDCEIPAENYKPVFYQKFEFKSSGHVRKDFELKKTSKKSNFKLIAFADVQIANSTDLNFLSADIPKIKEYLKTLDGYLVGISLGDLVWDNMDYFSVYHEQIARLEVPFFPVIGNHDHNQIVTTNDRLAAKDYEEFFGPAYYSYNIGDCHFVVLDDIYYEGRSNYSARITQEQLDWLEEDLKYVPKTKKIIIGTHIPTTRRNSTGRVSNNAELYKLLDGYDVLILSGHLHNHQTVDISSSIREINLGAVCGAFWSGDIANDGSSKGFAVFDIQGTQVKDWYFKPTNHDSSFQMRVYEPGRAVTAGRRDGVIVNVFAWHTDWTVSVYEDGHFTQSLTTNVKEQDRTAYDYYNLPPAYRPTEPEKNNDHMFYYKPQNDDWQEIKVDATDPYGKTYTEYLYR